MSARQIIDKRSSAWEIQGSFGHWSVVAIGLRLRPHPPAVDGDAELTTCSRALISRAATSETNPTRKRGGAGKDEVPSLARRVSLIGACQNGTPVTRD